MGTFKLITVVINKKRALRRAFHFIRLLLGTPRAFANRKIEGARLIIFKQQRTKPFHNPLKHRLKTRFKNQILNINQSLTKNL